MDGSLTAVPVVFLCSHSPCSSFLVQASMPFAKFLVGVYIIQSCIFIQRKGRITLLRIPSFLNLIKQGEY